MWEGGERGAGVLALCVALGRSTAVPATWDNTLTFGKPAGEDDRFYTSTKYWHCYFCKGEKVRREFALINQ